MVHEKKHNLGLNVHSFEVPFLHECKPDLFYVPFFEVPYENETVVLYVPEMPLLHESEPVIICVPLFEVPLLHEGEPVLFHAPS